MLTPHPLTKQAIPFIIRTKKRANNLNILQRLVITPWLSVSNEVKQYLNDLVLFRLMELN